MIERYINLCDDGENIDKSKKQMITWKNRNGPNEESDSAMSIQDRQMNNPDIIHELPLTKNILRHLHSTHQILKRTIPEVISLKESTMFSDVVYQKLFNME